MKNVISEHLHVKKIDSPQQLPDIVLENDKNKQAPQFKLVPSHCVCSADGIVCTSLKAEGTKFNFMNLMPEIINKDLQVGKGQKH